VCCSRWVWWCITDRYDATCSIHWSIEKWIFNLVLVLNSILIHEDQGGECYSWSLVVLITEDQVYLPMSWLGAIPLISGQWAPLPAPISRAREPKFTAWERIHKQMARSPKASQRRDAPLSDTPPPYFLYASATSSSHTTASPTVWDSPYMYDGLWL
jgi:hypothetical protein